MFEGIRKETGLGVRNAKAVAYLEAFVRDDRISDYPSITQLRSLMIQANVQQQHKEHNS